MTNTYIQDKLDDVRNQIMIAFKHLEHGVSFFNGIPVMEYFEEESMNQIIDEALKQSLEDYHNHIVDVLVDKIEEFANSHSDHDMKMAVMDTIDFIRVLQDTNPKE